MPRRASQPKRGAEPLRTLAHDVKADMRLAQDGHLFWIVALAIILSAIFLKDPITIKSAAGALLIIAGTLVLIF